MAFQVGHHRSWNLKCIKHCCHTLPVKHPQLPSKLELRNSREKCAHQPSGVMERQVHYSTDLIKCIHNFFFALKCVFINQQTEFWMNIDANAWIQPREKCNQTLSKPEDQRKGGEKKTAQVLVGEALLTWLLCLVSSLPLGRLCHVRGGRQEPKATGSPYWSRPKQRDTENCYL